VTADNRFEVHFEVDQSLITSNHRKLLNQCNPNHYLKDSQKTFDQLVDKNLFTNKYQFKTEKEITSIVGDSKNNKLYAGCSTGEILTFETETGRLVNTMKASKEKITCLELSIDNQTLYSGS